jgi:hypothetical protein
MPLSRSRSRRWNSIKTLAFLLLAAPSQAATQPTASTPATPTTPTPTPTTDDGPALDLAPEHTKTPPPQDQPALGIGAGSPSDAELVRGLTEQRFRSASASALSTSVGGYGEIHVRGTTRGREGEREWLADIPRLVVFVAHEFNDSFRSYLELEVEHSFACSTCPGAAELEQAYVDWKLVGDSVGLRAGLILVPMGIINQWHEPPIFHGVVRPRVETVVIPSTWREIGIGIFGQPHDLIRYELYAMTGLDPAGFRASGVGGGRQNGAFAAANAWALSGRVEVEPLLGVVIGASLYASDAGANGKFFDRRGDAVDLSLPAIGWAADARWRRSGIEWKVLFAEWRLPESRALMAAYNEAGTLAFPDTKSPVPTVMRGAYVEGAYDVLHPLGLSHQLLPFARIEHYNTQAEVPEGFEQNPTLSVREYTFGISYRPIQQIVFKADYQFRNRRLGFDETQLNFGAGFMY